MYKIRFLLFPLLFVQLASAQIDLENNLQNVIDSIFAANLEAVGIMVHVEAPDLNISWSGASGYSTKDQQSKLAADQPLLIASSIKTYVSAAMLRLVEQKKITIDQPIAALISNKTKALFTEDGYDLTSIQIQHLLSHTSGVWNYANQEYIDFKNENPKYRWTRDEQLQLTITKGDPLGAAGTVFQYSDANYLLLTEIIETVTGKPYYMAMATLLNYEELSLNDTWFPTLEKKPKGTKELVHQYWGAYNWDSYDLDISWDLYGGGGIAATTKDMATFLYQFFNGGIVKNDSIRDLIFTHIPTKATALSPYYLGLSQDNYHGMNAYGHGGFWSTTMLYFPTINASISVCILDRDKRALRRDVMDRLSKILLNKQLKSNNHYEKIRKHLDGLTDFSGTILVAHKNQVIEERAYGFANLEEKIENKVNTKFNLASISKLITAIAILQLNEQGQLKLDETVGKYLPNYPNASVRDSVSIDQLLTHTSGIPPFYAQSFSPTEKLSYKKVSDFIPLFENEPLSFSPGTQYLYSGSGFVLLGRIIEVVTGMDYYDYMDQFIFKKANMSNSLAIPIDSVVVNKANGYTCLWGDQDYYSRNDYYLAKASPAGFHYSTIHDLLQFVQGIGNGKLIKPETYLALSSPKVKAYNTHFGYGMDIDQRYDERINGHDGGWYGIRTALMHFPASEYTVVVLSNHDDDGKSGASQVIETMKTIIAGKKKLYKN